MANIGISAPKIQPYFQTNYPVYFFYFDESGSRDPKASETKPDGTVQAKDHIYSLTSIGLWEGRWRSFEREIANLKLQFTDQLNRTHRLQFNLADCEMKSNWIRNPKERADKSPFLTALSSDERERLVACYFRQIPLQHMTLFSVVVDKRKLRGHMTPETLHKKAYELILERIEHYMAEFHPKHHALIVMDDTDKALNRAVSLKHAFFQREGNQNVRFNHIVEYPFFTDSELSNGIQLADLCAYNVYRAFKTKDFAFPYFRELLPYYYKRQGRQRLDGLKVFPDDSELVAFAREGWDTFQKQNLARGEV